MAKRSAALVRAEKALASTRKRARDVRQKMKKDQPMEIAGTLGGAALAGYIDKENPSWVSNLGLENPSLIFGGALVAYGLFSSRSGQLEKVSTSAGTGMLSAYVYTYVKEMA